MRKAACYGSYHWGPTCTYLARIVVNWLIRNDRRSSQAGLEGERVRLGNSTRHFLYIPRIPLRLLDLSLYLTVRLSIDLAAIMVDSTATPPSWQLGLRQTPWPAVIIVLIILACM